MPFYEYACTLCGAEKTILQKISDPPATDCPVCGKPGLTKQISAAGFRLKGGGWYETDFKSDNKKNLAGEGSSGAPKAEKGAEKTAEKSDSGSSAATPTPAAATPAATSTPKPAAPAST
jgi:putative FmdB family regulatory protein